MLQTRKSRVIFVSPTTSYEINLTREQLLSGVEIEEHIVADVVSTYYWNQPSIWNLFKFHWNLVLPDSLSRRIYGRNNSTMTCETKEIDSSGLQCGETALLPTPQSSARSKILKLHTQTHTSPTHLHTFTCKMNLLWIWLHLYPLFTSLKLIAELISIRSQQ